MLHVSRHTPTEAHASQQSERRETNLENRLPDSPQNRSSELGAPSDGAAPSGVVHVSRELPHELSVGVGPRGLHQSGPVCDLPHGKLPVTLRYGVEVASNGKYNCSRVGP